ncbi:MAG: FkbM family methyltransferase [Candidatus Paceibacterota bacterium]|jgi:FkbM family methyltransferase
MNSFLARIGNLIDWIKISLALGDDPVNSAWLFFLRFRFWFLKKTVGDKLFKLRLKKFGQPFEIFVRDNGDLAVLKEVFWLGEYDLNLVKEPNTILDLGSNIGLTAIYFKLKYPKAKIYAFEPDPTTFKQLLLNTQKMPEISCYNLAISGQSGSLTFYPYPGSSMSSSLIKRLPNQEGVTVDAVSLDDVLALVEVDQVDLLKFDVEGAEDEIFSVCSKIGNISRLIGEVHLDLMKKDWPSFQLIFRQNGFVLTEKKISLNRLLVNIKKL